MEDQFKNHYHCYFCQFRWHPYYITQEQHSGKKRLSYKRPYLSYEGKICPRCLVPQKEGLIKNWQVHLRKQAYGKIPLDNLEWVEKYIETNFETRYKRTPESIMANKIPVKL